MLRRDLQGDPGQREQESCGLLALQQTEDQRAKLRGDGEGHPVDSSNPRKHILTETRAQRRDTLLYQIANHYRGTCVESCLS